MRGDKHENCSSSVFNASSLYNCNVMEYDHGKIEKKWQAKWLEDKAYTAKDKDSKPKFYALDMFPYPSGAGLHMGHPLSYTPTDIYARYMRLKGHNVLHPMGWDAFGLPAEDYAIKNKVHPAVTTKKNIKNFRKQMDAFGLGYDWDRELNTSSPSFYKWTQWIFLQLHKMGLAYKKEAPVNWDPVAKTVLANEQILPDGTAERSGAKVEQKMLSQWFFKITDYADKLIKGLDKVDWRESIKTAQRNWIGRSVGTLIKFKVGNLKTPIEVFTTRADTLFGVTYLVLAPEHKLLSKLKFTNREEVEAYTKEAKRKSRLERTDLNKDKTGVELKGVHAIHPLTKEKLPIWISDYVVADYGTGAVMAVPAHDERDWEFAKKYKLPVRRVIHRADVPIKSYLMGAKDIKDEDLTNLGIEISGELSSGDRRLIIPIGSLAKYEELIIQKMTPGFWNEYIGDEAVFLFKHKSGEVERLVLGGDTETRIDKLAAEFIGGSWDKQSVWKWLAENDWYADIILHFEYGVLENSDKFSGFDSDTAIAKINELLEKSGQGKEAVQYKLHDWLISRQRYWGAPIPIVYDPEGKAHPVKEKHLPWELPTDVDFKPTGQSPLKSSKEFIERTEKLYGKDWRPEFDTMDTFVCSSWYYLRYADPKNKTKPFDKKLMKQWLPVDLYVGGAEYASSHLLYSRFITKALHAGGYLPFDEPFLKLRNQGLILAEDGRKMSKSLGNVVNPDTVVRNFGADTARMYLMFMGPLEENKPWNTKGINGISRFIKKVWQICQDGFTKKADKGLNTLLNQTIDKVGNDIESLDFNTAISAMMILANKMLETKPTKEMVEKFMIILSPFAPHVTEELWHAVLKKKDSVLATEWPKVDESKLMESTVTIVVQVDGKTKGTIDLSAGVGEGDVIQALKKDDKFKELMKNKFKRTIYVSDKLINFVS